MQTLAAFSSPSNLYQAGASATLKVLLIQGDWETRRCFNQMGIHAGDRVRVLCKAPFGGPLVIENRGAQVAIGKQLAEKVQVELLP